MNHLNVFKWKARNIFGLIAAIIFLTAGCYLGSYVIHRRHILAMTDVWKLELAQNKIMRKIYTFNDVKTDIVDAGQIDGLWFGGKYLIDKKHGWKVPMTAEPQVFFDDEKNYFMMSGHNTMLENLYLPYYCEIVVINKERGVYLKSRFRNNPDKFMLVGNDLVMVFSGGGGIEFDYVDLGGLL